jgi:hypothetical protein
LQNVTFVGDFFSLLGAVSIIGYLQAGRSVRSWMPIFLYAMPVTTVSAIVLTIVALLVEGTRITGVGPRSAFGYFNPAYLPWVAYLAFGPGIVGHTGFNTLLRFAFVIYFPTAFDIAESWWFHRVGVMFLQILSPIGYQHGVSAGADHWIGPWGYFGCFGCAWAVDMARRGYHGVCAHFMHVL